MSKIQVPERLSEINLGQLIAIGDLLNGDYQKAIKAICNLTDHQSDILTNATLKAIRDKLERVVPVIVAEYVKTYTSGEYVRSFESLSVEPWEIQVARNPVSGTLAKWKQKRNLKVLEKTETYYIMEELAKEPANLWVQLLDGVVKAIAKVPEKEPWKAWVHFPAILAATAWRKGESRFKKDLNGNPVVDWDRVNKFKQVFLHVPAKDAIKAVTFFLTINEIYSKDPNSLSLVKKLMIRSSSLLKPGSSLRKDGGTGGI